MRKATVLLGLACALALAACQENPGPTAPGPAFAGKGARPSGTPAERAAMLAERINSGLAAAGSTKRLDEADFFTIGRGVDQFRTLRTGSRWTAPSQVTYMIEHDFQVTFDPTASSSALEGTVRQSYEKYNQVANIVLHLTELSYNGLNNDFLDGIVKDGQGNCIDIVDTSSPSVNSYDPNTGELDFTPVADNLFGGFVAGEYFSNCLGNPDILGVTWSFSDVDGALGQGTDGYRDRVYTEMFYNPDFSWTLSKAEYLNFLAPTDFETVITHEMGHTAGLGHFGGPNANEPFKLQPNGKVFDPEAIMNPFYIGGEKRSLLSSDIAALRALYSRKSLP